MPRTILVWFKNDLRLRDNETWYRACKQGDRVIPLYVFDPRQFVPHKLGFPRSGSFRTQFLIESVIALREKLRAIGSDLVVKIGLPEFVISEICTKNQVSDVFTVSEITDEEIQISNAVAHSLALKNIAFATFETTTLLHPANLPFEIAVLPDQFTTFRKAVERDLIVQLHFEEPEVKPLPEIDSDKIPTVQDLGLPNAEPDPRSVITYVGGEAAAGKRMQEYIWEKDLLKNYKETRNGLIGADYSSKFSPGFVVRMYIGPHHLLRSKKV